MTYHKKVIELKVAEWRFWDFCHNSENLIETWLATLSDHARELFQSLVKNNQKVVNPIHWLGLKHLKGGKLQMEHIWELRFSADNHQYRVLGYFGPYARHATFLIGCHHKQHIYVPPDALVTAVKRKKMLESGEATHNERKIAVDH